MASGSEAGGSDISPPNSERQMCVIDRTEAKINPLNMTLAARLHLHSEFEVILNLSDLRL